jgi:hypothetical protein
MITVEMMDAAMDAIHKTPMSIELEHFWLCNIGTIPKLSPIISRSQKEINVFKVLLKCKQNQLTLGQKIDDEF